MVTILKETSGSLLEERLKLDAQIAALEDRIKQIKAHRLAIDMRLSDALREADVEEVRRSGYRAFNKVQHSYTPTDWSAFHEFVYDEQRADLFQRRLVLDPLIERYEREIETPGINVYTYSKLAILKV